MKTHQYFQRRGLRRKEFQMNFAQRYVDSIHQHLSQVTRYFYGPTFGFISDLFQIRMRV